MLYPYRQPLVDEVAIQSVRCSVRTAIRRGWFRREQFDDLVQDAVVHLLQKLEAFDASRASRATYCSLVVRSFLSSRRRASSKTVCHESLDDSFTGTSNAEQAEEQHSVSKRFTRQRSQFEQIEFEEDVTTVVAQLPTELREVCEQFQLGSSVSHAAEQLGVSRNTVYRRIQLVRESVCFESLAEYR